MRVVVAEHNHLFRIGLRTVLEQQPDIEVVGDVDCEEAALPLLEAVRPDVVIIDSHLPGRCEMSLVQALRTLADVRMLMLCAHGEPDMVRRSLAAGVHGVVTKAAKPTELLRAVRAVAAGAAFLSVPLRSKGFSDVLPQQEPRSEVATGTRPASQPRRLSQRERQVLELFAKGHTHQQIADILGVRAKTVDTYRSRLGDKFGVRSRSELVENARELGLLRG
jgi:two-component system, NarL family, response regulator NreC